MASSDNEHLAPVIDMFAARAGRTANPANAADAADAAATADAANEGHGAWAQEPPESQLGDDITDSGGRTASIGTPADAGGELVAEPRFAVQPTADQSTAVQPTAVPPTAVQPTAVQPAAEPPTAAMTAAERRLSRDGFSEISQVSMRALARRGMSSHEMTQFLDTREFDADERDSEIARLEGSGLLDDAALAETLARTLRERKGLGASAIKAELRRRNIDQEHISAVLDDDRDEEQERAIEIAVKRAPQLRSLDSTTAKRRLTAFLMRRGYSGSVISAAVTAALAPNSEKSSGGPFFR